MARSLMIVDDDRLIRKVVREVFERDGVRVVEVPSGNDCLKEVAAGFRGIILMDIEMPEKDGWDTIRELAGRKLVEGNVILMLTGNDQPDDRSLGLQEYVSDYIRKPVVADRLLSSVSAYFEYLSA